MSERKLSTFGKILVGILFLLLGAIIVTDYFCNALPTKITIPLLAGLTLMLVLGLSEAFDSFQIGNLLRLRKNLKDTEEAFVRERKENADLRQMLITFSSNVNQTQSSNIFNLPPNGIPGSPTVTKAPEEEVRAQAAEEPEASEPQDQPTLERRRRLDFRAIESYALQQFYSRFDLSKLEIMEQAKLSFFSNSIDPVSTMSPVFDAYVIEKNIFVEVKLSRSSGMMFRDRLYVMLTNLYYYGISKKVSPTLIFLLVELPDDSGNLRMMGPMWETILKKDFKPALSSGLLRIETIVIPPDKMDEMYVETAGSV